MTASEEPEDGMRWRWKKFREAPNRIPFWEIWRVGKLGQRGPLVASHICTEADADRIIADHEAAADLAVTR